MVSLLVIMRELAERLNAGLFYPLTGTSTGGSVSTLIDSGATTPPGLLYSSGDSNALDRWWVYQEGDGEETRVTDGGYAGSSGTLTLSPDITGFGTDKYILSKPEWPFVLLKNAINLIVRNHYEESFFPLSMHIVGNDNNDMEGSGLDGDYSKSASAAIAAESTKVHNGAQSMKVTASAATQYAYTASIPVNENKQLYAAVVGAVDSGDSAEFRIINVDDSNATIENATSDEVAFMELVFQFTPPSGCERIQAWMISTANGDVSYWEDFQLWATGWQVYALPSWITRPAQMMDVRGFPQGTGGPASDFDYRPDERRSVHLPWKFERVDMRGDKPLRIAVECGSSRPYIHALRPMTAMSSDTATTPIDMDRIVGFAEQIVREPEIAEKIARTLRSQYFVRLAVVLPDRVGVR